MKWAALITWVITAGFGFFMLATWIRNGGARSGEGTASNFRPPVVFGHFLLAAAGLVVWIIYVATDTDALAWVALVGLVVVAGIGDILVVRWAKDRRQAAALVAGAGTSGAEGSRAAGGLLAEQHFPTPVVAAHGVFAVATVVLVLLVALGVGGS
jgi:hypothetical protein